MPQCKSDKIEGTRETQYMTDTEKRIAKAQDIIDLLQGGKWWTRGAIHAALPHFGRNAIRGQLGHLVRDGWVEKRGNPTKAALDAAETWHNHPRMTKHPETIYRLAEGKGEYRPKIGGMMRWPYEYMRGWAQQKGIDLDILG